MQFGRKTQRKDSRRRSERERVLLAGSVMSITRSRSISVLDLSFTGACVGGRDLPLAGDDMLFVVGSNDRMASVMWRFGDKCGIEFDQPLAEETMEVMKREGEWASVTGWVH